MLAAHSPQRAACVVLTGVSGTGKSCLGPAVAELLASALGVPYRFVEGDDYYLKTKPRVTLSDGQTVSNWDGAEALDWVRLSADVCAATAAGCGVLLSTFLPRTDLMKFEVGAVIELTFVGPCGQPEPCVPEAACAQCLGAVRDRCVQARRESKGWAAKPSEAARDELMVREVVLPAFAAARAAAPLSASIGVFGRDGRRPASELAPLVAAAAACALERNRVFSAAEN